MPDYVTVQLPATRIQLQYSVLFRSLDRIAALLSFLILEMRGVGVTCKILTMLYRGGYKGGDCPSSFRQEIRGGSFVYLKSEA